MSVKISAASEQPVIGVVLAGGMSTRLGQDKTRLRLHGEAGPDMLLRTARLLENVTPMVWISCRAGNPRPTGHYACVYDDVDNMGPFGGVLATLRQAKGPVLALSCDLPFMDAPTLERLLAARDKRSPRALMTTFLQKETGFIEALVSVYEYEALPRFERAMREGERQLNKIIPPELRAHIVYERGEALPFFNINHPADLETARRIMETV